MSKYDALGTYLRKQLVDHVPMTFAEIEKITGVKLPRSARDHRAWWSNNAENSVATKVWRAAGFRSAQVDMAKRRLVFERERERAAPGMAEEGAVFEGKDGLKDGRHPMIGALKGTFTIEPGWDLTKPALDEHELAEWEASLDRKADLIDEMLSKKR